MTAQKYEYRIISTESRELADPLSWASRPRFETRAATREMHEAKINRMASQGWEAVNMISLSVADWETLLKREYKA